MFFILPGILFCGFLMIAVWWAFFRAAVRHERTVREARRREAAFERLLATEGLPLYCVACRRVFRGPLEPDGCPECHLRSFVLPAYLSEERGVPEAVRNLPPIPDRRRPDQEEPTVPEAPIVEPTPLRNTLPQGKQP
ncbi:MAG: hypothetical protein SFU56_11005 [Capsulimonadales bacterium]|nr:hypothetical protein [Capsulimonadales bacterium]